MIAIILLVVLAIVLVIARAQSDKKQNEEAEGQSQKATNETWMGAFNAYDKAFNIIKKNPFFTLLLAAVTVVGFAVSAAVQGPIEPGRMWIPIEYVFMLPLMLVLPAYSLAAADGKNPSFASLYRRPVRVFAYLILAYMLAQLIIVASALLIVLFVWTLAWFIMTGFVVMDKNLSPIKALKESKRLAKDHIGKIWGIFGVSFLISIGLNLFALIPVSGRYIMMGLAGILTVWNSVALAVLYRWLQKNVKV